jgi:hypothetical protein
MRNKDILLQQQEELERQLKALQSTMKLADSLNEAEEILNSHASSDIVMALTITAENGKTTIKDMPADLIEEIKQIILAYNA